MKNIILSLLSILVLFSCSETENANNQNSDINTPVKLKIKNGKLPIIGQYEIDSESGDTIYNKIRDFSFTNQDGQEVNNATFTDKAYVVDFFFISCPTICPKVKKNMLRLHEKFESAEDLLLLSHTIDPKRDDVEALANYSKNLGVNSDKWHFVTGDKDEIYDISPDYFSIAVEDASAPGGYNHSGRLILVDKDRHVRSIKDVRG